jgi:uncharacterized membrane protein
MLSWYAVLKVVHVLSVVVWIGGASALALVTARLLRARDTTTLAAYLPQAAKFGQSMGGPASLLVLLTGIAMVLVGKIGFRPLWVSWGFVGVLLHFVFGALVMRKRTMRLAAALSATPADETRTADAGRSLRMATMIYLLIMTSVIIVMVLKPTLPP